MSVQEQQGKIKVASIQMQVISAEPLKNMVRAEGFINDAVSAGANALLLPELWTTGYSLDRFDALADEFHDSTLSFLQDAARRYHVSIIGGSFPEKRANGVYSTCYSIGPDGAVLASYSKEHLFPLLKGASVFATGDSRQCNPDTGWQVGLPHLLRYPLPGKRPRTGLSWSTHPVGSCRVAACTARALAHTLESTRHREPAIRGGFQPVRHWRRHTMGRSQHHH